MLCNAQCTLLQLLAAGWVATMSESAAFGTWGLVTVKLHLLLFLQGTCWIAVDTAALQAALTLLSQAARSPPLSSVTPGSARTSEHGTPGKTACSQQRVACHRAEVVGLL